MHALFNNKVKRNHQNIYIYIYIYEMIDISHNLISSFEFEPRKYNCVLQIYDKL